MRLPRSGHGSWPFVDRDDKLRALLGVIGGPEPAAVVVSGPRGTGKTRLAQEAVAALRTRGRRTEWATATRGAAAIPLGALAHLVPVGGGGSDPTVAWQAMASALHGTPAGQSAVVGIDDAHLLDDLSAALVHRLVLTRSATVVLTVLSGLPGPELVDALWRDGLATRMELRPLTRGHVEDLLGPALRGIPDSRTCERLWQASQGSVVLLHELVEAGQETQRLQKTGGLWRWHGGTPLTERLCEVVRTQMGEVTEAERAALELLAVSGSLELQDLVALSSSEVVAALERRGLVVMERASRHPVAHVAHPLDAEVLCVRVPQALANEFRHRLAGTESVRRWARENPVRIGALLLQLDGPPRNPDVLARAASQANALSDHELAERLARAALEDHAHPAASVALAEALRWQGDHDQAEQVAGRVTASPMPAHDREDLAITRMLNRFYGLGRADQALAALGPDVASAGISGTVAAEVGKVLRLSAGEPQKATHLEDDEMPPQFSPRLAYWTAITRTIGLGLAGHTEAALSSATSAWTAVDTGSGDTETSFARAALMQGELMALELDGRIPQAEVRAVELHDATMARARSATDAVAARGRGSAALAAGRPAAAIRWLTEAATQLEESDPIGCLQLCRAQLAQAHGLLGDPAAAAQVLAAGTAPSSVRAFEPQTFLAEAWWHAADHRVPAAGEAAMRAAASAAGMEQWAVEAWALHTAARLGLAAEVGRRLQDLAGEIGSRTVRAFAAHAAAAAGSLGESLDDVAEEFSRLGARALAADAFAEAAEAHRNAGHRRRAAAAGARATALVLSGGGLHSPALDRLAPNSLTQREWEIASLAAEGVSNQGIAGRLVLSVRTVETHLAHVYDKLGINGRAALREALSFQNPF